MAHKPSGRTNRTRPSDELNITPLIDMVTCLMFFLMMFASIMPVVVIDAPLPKIAETADEIKQAKDSKNKLEVVIQITSGGFTVKSDYGPDRTFPLAEGKYPYVDLHKYLVQLKAKKPDSREITLLPADDVAYEVMIGVMDSSRELIKDDLGFAPVPPEIARKPESAQFNRLFPDVSIGGV
jgi:biopolymer transport protein ExbD